MLTDCLDRLVVPESIKPLLTKQGVTPPYGGDRRRFVRRYVGAKAVLATQNSLPGRPRKPERHVAVVVDISRSGVCLLHSEQLFPCEQALLTLTNDKQLPLEIAWCRRLGPQCYKLGAKFTQGQPAAG